jgi:hypothetical protein
MTRSMIRYAIRHWRGALPLAVAFWINGIALTAVSLGADTWAAGLGLGSAIDTKLRFAAYLAAGIVILLLLPAWQVVGLFRSADRHIAEAGTIVAGRLVQSLTTVLAIGFALRLLVFAGEAWSGARVAWPLGRSAYTISTAAGGRLLEVKGGFVFGLADDVRRALEANPRVRRLRLESGGGSLSEAIRVRELIRARHLDTESRVQCSSACVSAYIGGSHRLLRRSARLGFHLPRNPGYGLRGTVTADYAAEIAYFRRQGVPRWFRSRWIMTGRVFWYPTPRQLRAAGIVDAFVGMPRPGEAFYY